jgi:hypothetical protein
MGERLSSVLKRRCVLAATLPRVRTFLLIMTIVGGLLALVAAVWVAVLSRRDRWLQRNLYRLGDKYQRELILHSRAYQAYKNQRAERERTGQGPIPVAPFGGMDEKAHQEQLFAEHVQRVKARTGRDPLRPESDKDVHRDVIDKLYRPALLAGLGVLLSTIASALSLYLPPDV